jgi:PEP-CTERM motif
MKILGFAAALSMLLVLATPAFADNIPTRGRSSYGDQASTVLNTSTSTSGGVSFNEQEFCSDANTIPSEGLCQIAFGFQITSVIPTGSTAMTITLPIPSNTTFVGAGLLTNDDAIMGGTVFFSPFTMADVLALPDTAITTNALGNALTFTLPIALSGAGDGMALFLDISDNNNSEGLFCFQKGTSCTATDIPDFASPEVTFAGATAPEPGTLPMLAMALAGLGAIFLRRRKTA